MEIPEALRVYFDMGGYGGFVWSAYGITFVVLVMLAVVTVRGSRARTDELARLQAAFGSRREAAFGSRREAARAAETSRGDAGGDS